jgi:uncharacterized protein (DUF1800 family)
MRFRCLLAALVVMAPGLSQPQTVVTARAAARFLDQATWGPTPESIAQVQSVGFEKWLAAQFALNTSDLPDQPILNAQGKSNNNSLPVQAAFFQNALSGQDQLRQRIAFILSQIWVVSQQAGLTEAYAYPPYWRILRDNAFGNYRDVIKAVTLSPAMGRFLNMANNNKANPAKGTVPNENYARELMQLFTLGLVQLNLDGSPVMQNGVPLPTYNPSVVTNMSRLLTGWTYPATPGTPSKTNNPPYFIGQMISVDAEHDKTEKTIFGNVTIPAGQTAEQDLESLLDALMAQPTMAPFVSQQLIEHLVTSNPSPAFIERISNVFENDGQGVKGNLQAVITAILMDPEARQADDQAMTAPAALTFSHMRAQAAPVALGHMREPILFMTNVLRGLNAKAVNLTVPADAAAMGENLFNANSVFSYFSPQSRTEFGLVGPEFQIYSTQTAADRVNTVNSILYGSSGKAFEIDLTPFAQHAGDASSLLSYISGVFLHGSMSSALEQAAAAAVSAASTSLAKTQAALYVVLTSPEYQIIQ